MKYPDIELPAAPASMSAETALERSAQRVAQTVFSIHGDRNRKATLVVFTPAEQAAIVAAFPSQAAGDTEVQALLADVLQRIRSHGWELEGCRSPFTYTIMAPRYVGLE